MNHYGELIELARTCSAQAWATTNEETSAALKEMAKKYERRARDRAEKLGQLIQGNDTQFQAD